MTTLTIETATEPVYVDAEHTRVRAMVKFAEWPTPIPFTAVADDPEPHGRELHGRLLAGEFGAVAAFVPLVFRGPVRPVDLYTALATYGHISEPEALAAVASKQLPAVMLNSIAGLPNKFLIQMHMAGADKFMSDDPMLRAALAFLDDNQWQVIWHEMGRSLGR
jgi:hypothetical protein